MINRLEIKERSKVMLSQNYWKLVGIVLLGMILMAGISLFNSKVTIDHNSPMGYKIETSKFMSILTIAYTIFVGNVIAVGLCKICLAAYRGENFEVGDLFAFFNADYLRVVGAMALVTLFTTIGFLLLVVPGIIASIGLSRVAYLLADGDSRYGMEIISKSWEIMKGHKNEFFVFILSFIGWALLTAITAGIVGVFYANPYAYVSFAGYHDELMKLAPVEG